MEPHTQVLQPDQHLKTPATQDNALRACQPAVGLALPAVALHLPQHTYEMPDMAWHVCLPCWEAEVSVSAKLALQQLGGKLVLAQQCFHALPGNQYAAHVTRAVSATAVNHASNRCRVPAAVM